MVSYGTNSREIMDRKEIHDVLVSALMHQWSFSYLAMVRNHLSSQSTRLYSVSPEYESITVSGAVLDALTHSMTNRLYFNARSGGISILFNSTLVLPAEGNSFVGKPKFCKFEFPDALRYSQKRMALRVNLTNKHEIPVTLFVDLDKRFHGKVVDISETGAKIMIEGNIVNHLKGAEIISDCQMLMPDKSCIENRIRVLGLVYDPDREVSYLRCEYVETNINSEAQIKKLIFDEVSRNKRLKHEAVIT